MTHAKFEQLLRRMEPGSMLLRHWTLTGGISAQITALEVQRTDGQTTKMIVRQHGPGDLADNPRIAADEFKLLSILQAAGLATPAPYYVDESNEIFETPVIVIAFIDGMTEFAPASLPDFIQQMAAQLARIHTLKAAEHDLAFLPQQVQRYTDRLHHRPATLDDSLDEGRIRDILGAVWPLSQRNASVLLHGDYWPGNILWKDGQLAAVIDWEDAGVGEPLADVGNMRMELLWTLGQEAMQQFTDDYRTLTGIDFTHLPYWDLCAALRPASRIGEWAGDPVKEAHMRECHQAFRTQAYEALSSR